jgi:transposase
LCEDLYRAFGVDLTEIPGVNSLTAQMLLTEIGPNLDRFPTAASFCSWLTLCPDPKISGGQVLSSRTRPTKNRTALALRVAIQVLHRSDCFLGYYFRRMKAWMGAPKAMTAMVLFWRNYASMLLRLLSYLRPLPNNSTGETAPDLR